MRRGQARWLAIGTAIAVVAIGLAVVLGAPVPAPKPGTSGASGSPHLAGTGPVVYYEIVDADASHLVERRLDGRSPARIVASRVDAAAGPTWTVDPTATIAVAIVPVPGAVYQLVAYDVATGAEHWSTPIPFASTAD